MELLAPAGSFESLCAAVASGADAVYIGGSRFSARATAQNFDDDMLQKSVEYCKIRGVKVHIAANILIKENEVSDFIEYIGYLNGIGADAVIIQDIGMANKIHRIYPDLPIHASTQMTCASLESAKFLEKMGFSRIVLARELSMSEIEHIKKNINAEIEVFVHGAICMSYSGQCLMSSMIGARSGNRGQCAQPCRLPYKFVNNGKTVNKGYLLSPKDLCLAEYIEKLNEIGVDSLKIEGRLKRPEYVSQVTGIYRKCIDEMRSATECEKQELLDAFNRSGFTKGYFINQLGTEMMSYGNPSNISENKFSQEAKSRCGKDIKKIPVKIFARLKRGQTLEVTISDYENYASVSGNIKAEDAINNALSKDRLVGQLQKLGNTSYRATDTEAEIDSGITVPISEINDVRRKAVELLSKFRSQPPVRRVIDEQTTVENKPVNENCITAGVLTYEQAKICIEKGIRRIYASGDIIKKLLGTNGNCEFVQRLAPIDKENKRKEKIVSDKLLISSVGQISDKKYRYFVDYRLNITNSQSLNFFRDFECVTISPELTVNEIKNIKKPCDTEIIVYGRLPLMTFENCPAKALGMCGEKSVALSDRMGEVFPLVCTNGCFSILLNSKPIFMADKYLDLQKTGAKFFRLEFTDEDSEECERIIQKYIGAASGEKIQTEKENTFTRGHYFRQTVPF